MNLVTPMTNVIANTISKKHALPVAETVAAAISTSPSLVAAGHDNDGEEILVEAEPLPHEIATDPSLRCRYPSKHCLRARTIKKTGALHSMCAFHRAKANRNQRRLEKRKRLRLNSNGDVAERAPLDSADRPQHLTMMLKQEPTASTTDLLMTTFSPGLKGLPRFQSPREVAIEFEPFHTPAALFPEDLEELCELVNVDVDSNEEAAAVDLRLLSQLLL